MAFFFEQYPVGQMQNFNYVVGCPQTKQGACFDPAFDPQRALDILAKHGLELTTVFLTHNHWDHIDGLAFLVEQCHPKVFIHALDQAPIQEITDDIVTVDEGDKLTLGEVTLQVLHTPGHTPGSVCYLIDDHTLVSGDTLFQGNCGRCDLPGGSSKQMFTSLNKKLKYLDPKVIVYPGHDYGSKPVSTIGYEVEHNPVMQADTYEDFIKVP
jgi:hydroxyacylglutathione hydrolase